MSTMTDAEVTLELLDHFSGRELIELAHRAKENGDNGNDDAPDPPAHLFQKRGEDWRVRFDGRTVWFKHRVGLEYIARLLSQPGSPLPVSVLHQNEHGWPSRALTSEELDLLGESVGYSAQQSMTDRAAISACAARLLAIAGELEHVEQNGDAEVAQTLRREKEQINAYLRSCSGKNGRIRSVPDNLERIRKSVSNAITRAIDAIADENPALGRHLRCSVNTGYNVQYSPPKDRQWEVS